MKSGADRIPARKLGKPKDIPKIVTTCGEHFGVWYTYIRYTYVMWLQS
jgi:hypothetical protein